VNLGFGAGADGSRNGLINLLVEGLQNLSIGIAELDKR
jgi:hypothetical protein